MRKVQWHLQYATRKFVLASLLVTAVACGSDSTGARTNVTAGDLHVQAIAYRDTALSIVKTQSFYRRA